jgi:hypothetical protein
MIQMKGMQPCTNVTAVRGIEITIAHFYYVIER